MQWSYSIRNKTKVAVAIISFILLLVFTHINDKRHFTTLHQSFTSVYKDRLMAETYIYGIARELNAREIALIDNACADVKSRYLQSDSRIAGLLSEFKTTTLTREEGKLLGELIQDLSVLEDMERRYAGQHHATSIDGLGSVKQQYDKINNKLTRLSEIQTEEGQKLMASSIRVKASNY